ncbi:MAG: GTPase Era [Desulfovibrionaceae bacterium]|nr:GTPase Era [Desulfovibrionaceae bacterium]
MENRCGRVALLGPPNAGKSTLLNALLGQKVTIVTPKPQTTRTQIVGILSEENSQAIFLDTPGLAQVRGRLSKTMNMAIWESLRQADLLMPVLDGQIYVRHLEQVAEDLGPLMQALIEDTRPVIIVVNKIDLFADKSLLLPLFDMLHKDLPRAELFPVSALEKDGIPKLRELVAQALPIAPREYPLDQLSTQPERFLVAELIREKLFLYLHQEVPYNLAVDIENWEECAATGQIVINGLIYVTKPMYKAMIIGHGGSMLKKIGSEARQEIQTLLGRKVHLELWVKVRDHWYEDPAFLRDLGLVAEDM